MPYYLNKLHSYSSYIFTLCQFMSLSPACTHISPSASLFPLYLTFARRASVGRFWWLICLSSRLSYSWSISSGLTSSKAPPLPSPPPLSLRSLPVRKSAQDPHLCEKRLRLAQSRRQCGLCKHTCALSSLSEVDTYSTTCVSNALAPTLTGDRLPSASVVVATADSTLAAMLAAICLVYVISSKRMLIFRRVAFE